MKPRPVKLFISKEKVPLEVHETVAAEVARLFKSEKLEFTPTAKPEMAEILGSHSPLIKKVELVELVEICFTVVPLNFGCGMAFTSSRSNSGVAFVQATAKMENPKTRIR